MPTSIVTQPSLLLSFGAILAGMVDQDAVHSVGRSRCAAEHRVHTNCKSLPTDLSGFGELMSTGRLKNVPTARAVARVGRRADVIKAFAKLMHRLGQSDHPGRSHVGGRLASLCGGLTSVDCERNVVCCRRGRRRAFPVLLAGAGGRGS